ncbi:MAG: TldD/PmbA family protein [Gemmatimonadetes bacterium]|nr:TldD/PmbA family protein [Gemmatimonadota bacterium]
MSQDDVCGMLGRRRVPTPLNHPLPRAVNQIDRREFVKIAGVTGVALAAGTGAFGCGPTAPIIGSGPAPDATERELALFAIDEAISAGAGYVDVRISRHWNESVSTREERITNVSRSESYGIGVRALVGGSWGFSATSDVSRASVAAAAREAASIARANDRIAPSETVLAPVASVPDGRWVTPHEVDPFDVSIEEKADLLFRANAGAMRVSGVEFVNSSIGSVKESRLVATSEGSVIQQTFIRMNPSMNITAFSSDRSDFQSRGSVAEPAGRGWEYVLGLDFPGNAPRWAEEAVMKLSAAPVDAGTWDLVLHPSNLWLTIHESIAHPTELDRTLGYEANYAGTSFIFPPEEALNDLRLGPDFMTFIGNRTEEGGCATTGWDDEGVAATSWPIIENGIFVNYQTTREQAAWIAAETGIMESLGCAYGQNWASIPFQRMPNVSLMPGEQDLSEDDVIAATDHGILVEGRGSYSIDQQRYNFQFAGQVFWEIRNGTKYRMLRDVAYQGRTPEFWNSMALLGGPATYYMGASFSDAKGQPSQLNAVSHGCPMALFRDVNILNTA